MAATVAGVLGPAATVEIDGAAGGLACNDDDPRAPAPFVIAGAASSSSFLEPRLLSAVRASTP